MILGVGLMVKYKQTWQLGQFYELMVVEKNILSLFAFI
jgi:hypothetical protein